MSLKEKVINEIIRIEGGYVDDPDDSGGETNFGITIVTARAYGYEGSMRDLPREIAFNIYAAKYWDAVCGDELARLSECIAVEVVDTGVNAGVGRSSKFLQRALNALNDRAKLYRDITVDGVIGTATISALRSYLSVRNEKVLATALNCLQGAFYIHQTVRREKDEKFLYGWLKNRVVI